MSEVFNINRFWKYFVHDLKSAKSNYWLSLIVCGLTPLVGYIIYEIPMLLFQHHFGEYQTAVKVTLVFFAFFIVLISFPAKAYGSLTDKKAGSNWILLPASTLEKYISMILITCIAVPAALAAVVFASDFIFSLVLPRYGHFLLSESVHAYVTPDLADVSVYFNVYALLFLNWVCNSLAFTLGAVCFKKAKIVKTYIAGCIIGIICFIIVAVVLAIFTHGFDETLMYNINLDEEEAIRWIKFLLYSAFTIWILAVGSALYLRVKTIKH